MRWMVLAAVTLACGAAAAQPSRPTTGPDTPRSPDSRTENLRSFDLRNRTSKVIEQAQVTTTLGRERNLTRVGAVRPNEFQSFRVPAHACVESVSVQFRDGGTLRQDHLQDCRLPHIIVRSDRIDIDTSAAPTHAPHFGVNKG